MTVADLVQNGLQTSDDGMRDYKIKNGMIAEQDVQVEKKSHSLQHIPAIELQDDKARGLTTQRAIWSPIKLVWNRRGEKNPNEENTLHKIAKFTKTAV